VAEQKVDLAEKMNSHILDAKLVTGRKSLSAVLDQVKKWRSENMLFVQCGARQGVGKIS